MSLPPLPLRDAGWIDDRVMVFTPQQMEEYGRACRAAALEEAAKIVEDKPSGMRKDIAAAIRALKDAPDPDRSR